MKHIYSNSLLFLLGATIALAAEQIRPDQTIAYKTLESSELKLHVFNPLSHAPSDQSPVIVFFFGGGWSGGTPRQFYQQARDFARQGLVAISAEYRTKRTHKTTPFECVEDGKSAIRWVRQHANELGVDPNRIAVLESPDCGRLPGSAGIIQQGSQAGTLQVIWRRQPGELTQSRIQVD